MCLNLITFVISGWIALTFVLGLGCAANRSRSAPPLDLLERPYDYVIIHAKLLTDDNSLLSDHALAIRDGQIVTVEESQTLQQKCAPPCSLLDAQYGLVVPGFNDAHTHLALAGLAVDNIRLSGLDLRSYQNQILKFAEQHQNKSFLYGSGWQVDAFAQRLPSKEDLDQLNLSQPILLFDSTNHLAWANSLAMRDAHIDASTPDPPGGQIYRAENSIEPSGLFGNFAATFIKNRLPQPSQLELERAILAGQELSIANGFTTSQGGPIPLSLAKIYFELERQGRLKQRTYTWGDLHLPPKAFDEFVVFAKSLPENALFHISAFKGFVDGVFESQTALLLRPYARPQGYNPSPVMDQPLLNALVLRANKAGFPVALHAVGDGGVHMALDAYQNSYKRLHHALINRIEHAELIGDDDMKRFRKLNVAVVVEPARRRYYDKHIEKYLGLIGPERQSRLYPWGKILQNNGLLAFGTDYLGVGKLPDPLRDCQYLAESPLRSPLPLDLMTAIKAYTLWPAQLVTANPPIGRIAKGYQADLLILNVASLQGLGEPRTLSPHNQEFNRIKLVMVRGRPVWPAPAKSW